MLERQVHQVLHLHSVPKLSPAQVLATLAIYSIWSHLDFVATTATDPAAHIFLTARLPSAYQRFPALSLAQHLRGLLKGQPWQRSYLPDPLPNLLVLLKARFGALVHRQLQGSPFKSTFRRGQV